MASALPALVLLALVACGQGRGAPAGAPPWPGSAWVPYDPRPNYVGTRAAQLLSQLWDLRNGRMRTPPYVTERGARGEWVTYAAQWHGPSTMGITAFRARA